jgi:hypothetical protein
MRAVIPPSFNQASPRSERLVRTLFDKAGPDADETADALSLKHVIESLGERTELASRIIAQLSHIPHRVSVAQFKQIIAAVAEVKNERERKERERSQVAPLWMAVRVTDDRFFLCAGGEEEQQQQQRHGSDRGLLVVTSRCCSGKV